MISSTHQENPQIYARRKTRFSDRLPFTHDALNRLATKMPSGRPSVAYGYDRAGRLLNVTDGAGLTSYTYDALGRRSSVVHPGGKKISYQYDASGNRSRLDYPDGHFVTYEHDQMNRLQRIADLGTTSIAFFTYDALSRLSITNRLNNATTTYAYEIDDDVASVSHLFNGGIRVDFGYAYNAVHNRKFISPSDSRFVFNFLAPVEANYANNNMNQATSVAFEPQGAGQGTTYALGYDLNDNLGSGLNPNSYTHDVENRLISATTPNDSITYTYDAFGTRTSKTVDGVVTKYILDGDQVIAEYDGSANAKLLRRYVYAGLDQPIQMVTPSSTYYYHADALGSVIALSDAGANRVETYALGPYGQVNRPSSRGNPYLYTGREYDEETGLYYYRNRYYDPEMGRFLEPDPAGFSDGLNLYAYVGGNPVNFVDPLGLTRIGPGGGQSRANENALTRARPPGRANVQGPANFFDVEANQELTITVQNPNFTGIAVRVIAGLPGARPNEIFAPTSPVGGFLAPIGGSVQTTVSAFGTPPIEFRVRVDVGGDLGVFVRFDTRGPVPTE